MLFILKMCQANVATVPSAFVLPPWSPKSTIWLLSIAWWSPSLYSLLNKEVHGDFKCQLNLSETEVRGVSAKVTVILDAATAIKGNFIHLSVEVLQKIKKTMFPATQHDHRKSWI
jgi:hypothetical protein